MKHFLSRKVFHAGVVIATLAIMIAAAVPALNVSAQPAQQTTWNLVWSDEFNGSGQPSSTNWNYNVGNGYNPGLPGFQGWGNGEWEWYRPEECYQSGGNLVLRGEYFSSPTNIAGRDWYQRSCRITSDTKRSINLGKIEARIQMPNANGSWPAFWMMGDACDDTSTGNYGAPISYYDTMASNWASCGEVDIMEHKNSETTVYNNIFWDLRTGLFPWTAGQNANYGTSYNAGNVATFHTYSIEWDQTYIRWFFDGTQTHVIDITPATLEEFHKPFHLILNLALGGAFPAMDPVQSQFPLYMNVDYVRVYQAGSGGGWTNCANENGTCSFSGTMAVRYGANSSYYYRTATGSIACNNATFGDPIVGTVKHCDYSPQPPNNGWTQCASENGTCSFSGTMGVAYGANGAFFYRPATGSIACNNATFGDPIFGTAKACYYK